MSDLQERNWYCAPGEIIEEHLEEKGWSQTEFARRMEMSEEVIGRLMRGSAILTEEIALKLERVLGSTSQFWRNLERIYRNDLARLQREASSVANHNDQD